MNNETRKKLKEVESLLATVREMIQESRSGEKSWHKKYTDPLIGGLKVGQIGAMKHILDEDGESITQGYHSFWMHKGTLMGSVGARDERITYSQ